jgi:hypothetical protein
MVGRPAKHDLTLSIDLDDYLWIKKEEALGAFNASDDYRLHIKRVRDEAELAGVRIALTPGNARRSEHDQSGIRL